MHYTLFDKAPPIFSRVIGVPVLNLKWQFPLEHLEDVVIFLIPADEQIDHIWKV